VLLAAYVPPQPRGISALGDIPYTTFKGISPSDILSYPYQHPYLACFHCYPLEVYCYSLCSYFSYSYWVVGCPFDQPTQCVQKLFEREVRQLEMTQNRKNELTNCSSGLSASQHSRLNPQCHQHEVHIWI